MSSSGTKKKAIGKTKAEVKSEPTTKKTSTLAKAPEKTMASGFTDTTLLVNGEVMGTVDLGSDISLVIFRFAP